MEVKTLRRHEKKPGKFSLQTLMASIAVVAVLCYGVNKIRQRTYGHFSHDRKSHAQQDAKMIALGLFINQTANPSGVANQYDSAGRPMHSWRVLLLPELERTDLFNQYDFNQPWDSPHNLKLVDKMPHCFASPFWQDEEANRKGLTPYRTIWSGEDNATERLGDWGEMFSPENRPIVIQDFANPVPWTKPDGIMLDQILARTTLDDPRMNGTLFIFTDGSVKVVAEEDRGRLEVLASEALGKSAFDRKD
ncbi:DUF1559 domain-containing protein [Bremerella cremea]|uniref:DUF1559 domain-containing protein n=1 Tax=Blastopirellula marina TaxID=124 RepID=A0A2S8FIY1_9BACT|nr:DUF1559 domain-containing protein [Blastopirellula marina]PQO32122.1 hypothetical protein C5Y83_17955 [Blastopirellula marina]RCS45188.1 DUF1559 domain-containing protein [Bremerella cremea]